MISVCMATYNGERYVQKQLESILEQLDDSDEVIICDDCSTDKTVEIIKEFNDHRIKLLINNNNIGVNKSFERTLMIAQGEIVFFSDQDDLWLKNKKKIIVEYFHKHKNIDVVQHDAIVVNEDMSIISDSFYRWRGKVGPGIIRNMIRDTHLGCCMAFRRKIITKCMPITEIPYHDKWVGIISECLGYKNCYIDDKLIYYVRHSKAATKENLTRRPWNIILIERLKYIVEIIKHCYRVKDEIL